MKMTAYKFVEKDLRNQGFQWEIGKWFKQDGKLELCENGFHASKEPIDVLEYTSNGERLFIVEARGRILEDTDKFCSSEMRLVKEIPISVLQWFAIACVRRTLKHWDKKYPNDKRPQEAIEAAENYLNNPTKENLEKLTAAWSAAWSAWSAWSAAWSAWSARSAAESAAESARSAAESAAESARSAAESAAESAWSAWSAAWSAWSAAWSAWSAWSAAWSAWSARSAAWSAEREWQNNILKKLIKEAIK
jgi:hypothetical protein